MNEIKKCIYCGEILYSKTVFLYNKRKDIVDKCDSCCNKLERGVDLYD